VEMLWRVHNMSHVRLQGWRPVDDCIFGFYVTKQSAFALLTHFVLAP